jgi:hypothetical protein
MQMLAETYITVIVKSEWYNLSETQIRIKELLAKHLISYAYVHPFHTNIIILFSDEFEADRFRLLVNGRADFKKYTGEIVTKESGKPFKSGSKEAKVVGIDINPYTSLIAFKLEDDSLVDVHQTLHNGEKFPEKFTKLKVGELL